MKLFKCFLIILTIWCHLQCASGLQTSQVAEQNGTRTSGFNVTNKNKTHTNGPADYDLCGKPSRNMGEALVYPSPIPGDFPWMALISYRSSLNRSINFKCEAILISRQWVLTAAHCMQRIGSFKPEFVRLGAVKFNNTLNYSAKQNDFSIDSIISHPEYSSPGKSDDLALIRLKVAVNYTKYIRPICLLNEPKFKSINEYYKGKSIDIVGYNILWDKDRPDDSLELRTWTTKIMNQTKCAGLYAEYKQVSIDGNKICVENRGGDTCRSILGGALLYRNVTERRFYLGGIISFESPCFSNSLPSVFTKITPFIHWIVQITGEKFF